MRAYGTHVAGGSPYSSIKRGTYMNYEQFKQENAERFNANEQSGINATVTNNEAIMPVTDAYGNPIPQNIPPQNVTVQNIMDNGFGVIIHSTTKTDATGMKIKIDSPSVPYRSVGIDEALVYGRSWVIGDAYAIDTLDPYFKANYRGTARRANPSNKLAATFTTAFMLFIMGLANILYEMLIFVFENMDMTDDAFDFIDNFIYYGQFALPVIVIVIGLISLKRLHKKNIMFVTQMIKDHLVTEEKQRYEYTHEFLPVCPHCGAARQSTEVSCIYCGASLIRNKDDIANS